MFVGPSLCLLLCVWFVVLNPLVQSTEVMTNPERARRWLAFYFCGSVVVVPWCLLFPVSVPFYHEFLLVALAYLASSDAGAALGVYEEWLVPQIEAVTRYFAATPSPPPCPEKEEETVEDIMKND